jgi:hypothetical protein
MAYGQRSELILWKAIGIVQGGDNGIRSWAHGKARLWIQKWGSVSVALVAAKVEILLQVLAHGSQASVLVLMNVAEEDWAMLVLTLFARWLPLDLCGSLIRWTDTGLFSWELSSYPVLLPA